MKNSGLSLFDAFEVGNKIDKQSYKEMVPDIRVDLVNSQYEMRVVNQSVLIILAGNDRKSVNEALDVLHEWMDARYLHTQVFLPPSGLEKEFPSYWRYWKSLPPAGRIGCFLGAWPMQAFRERLSKHGSPDVFVRRIRHMQALEKTLVDNGTQVLKFWFHIPKDEAKKRIKKAKSHPENEPYLRQEDWEVYEHYEEVLPVVERLIKETSTALAPWHIIEATDAKYRNVSLAQKLLDVIKPLATQANSAQPEKLGVSSPAASNQKLSAERSQFVGHGPLDTVDLSLFLEKTDYKEKLKKLQSELNRLAIKARNKFSTVLVFEGWDAAGKGGVIRRITKSLFAQDYKVHPIAAPSEEEHKYHYLWRFWQKLPPQGRIAIFDRSWYGRVLVERVEGFAEESEWQRAFYEIKDFEDQMIGHNMLLCKFWLQIDPDEQMARFKERETLPYKNHKITEEDYRNREKWDVYTEAANEMITRTSTSLTPWHLISANNKRWARIEVLKILVEELENKLKE